jgi:pimeloyl-ACP methyl ester carboxylesterase
MPSGLQYLHTDGGKLAVELTGNETDPLVICSPALGDTRDAYGPLAKALVSHGYRVANMDARGHGDSSVDFNRYGDEATADDFITVADEYSHGAPVILAGASFGAAAAAMAAAKQPDRISKIILLGPFLRNGMADDGDVREALGTSGLDDVRCDTVAGSGPRGCEEKSCCFESIAYSSGQVASFPSYYGGLGSPCCGSIYQPCESSGARGDGRQGS